MTRWSASAMDTGETVRSALASLAQHKLRSMLTMLGMIFGVGAVIAMLAIGGGAERQAQALIERLGLRNVMVRALDLPDEELREIRRKSPGLGPRDAGAIAEAVVGVAQVLPRVEIDPWALLAAGRKGEARVSGVSAAHAAALGLAISEGRFLDALDERDHAQVCVVGAGVRRRLFGAAAALGATVKINDVWLEVVGVLVPQAVGGASFQGVAIGSTDGEIYLPVSTALRKFDRGALAAPYDELIVRLAPEATPQAAATVIRGLLDQLHARAADTEIVVPEALLEQSRRTQRLFALVMGSIAGISLLVGGIGIMNILLATVLERTREIGVRRAVGATRRDIRNQFLVEAFTLSVLGGAAGIALGIGLAYTIGAAAGWPTVVTAWSVALATGVAVAVGLASGLYPASRAAALPPIDALRYE